jgi:hypothetical protein
MILVEEKRVLYLVFKNTNFSNNSELYDYPMAEKEKENEKEKETKKNAKKSFVNNEINELNTVIDDSTFIIMGKYNETFKVDRQSDIEAKKGEKLLFHIRKKKDFNYLIENPIPSKISEENTDILNLKLYLVINSENNEKNINEDYYICNNDIIKFGNLKYTVEIIMNKKENINNKSSIENEIKEKNESLTDVNEEAQRHNSIDNENEMNEEEPTKTTKMDYDISSLNKTTGCILDYKLKSPLFYDTLNDNFKINCYLCPDKECNKNNPIIKICNCNFAHFECLKDLAKRKLIIKENKKKNVRNYYIKRIMCKNCKCMYPYQFKINEKIFNVLDIETSKESDYLILKSIENKNYFNIMMLIHVIELNDEIIKIGRSYIDADNDVIIEDPSVSKEHAIIKYNKENGSLMLKNNKSKYGTLVLIKKSLKINEKKIQIQVGKTVVEAQVMKYGDFEKNYKNRNSKYPLPKKY